MSPAPVPACPECNGPWLNGWRWQHDPAACPVLAHLDATQAADVQRMRARYGTFHRAPTPTEAAMWGHVTGTPLQQHTTVLAVGGSIAAPLIGGRPSAADVAAPTTRKD